MLYIMKHCCCIACMSKRTKDFISAIEIDDDEKLIKKIYLLWDLLTNGYNGELTGLAKYH